MKCKLCGKPTGKFLVACHPECEQILHNELLEMDAVLFAFERGGIGRGEAITQIIRASSTEYIQKLFWDIIPTKSDIRSYEHLLFSYRFVEVTEERNRCRMERTGLSYARYPKWESTSEKICDMARLALTDGGVYFLDLNAYYIPYSKIADVGVDTLFTRKRVYFDVKTSSSQRHRYCIWALDKKDRDFEENVYSVIRLMVGIPKKIKHYDEL